MCLVPANLLSTGQVPRLFSTPELHVAPPEHQVTELASEVTLRSRDDTAHYPQHSGDAPNTTPNEIWCAGAKPRHLQVRPDTTTAAR